MQRFVGTADKIHLNLVVHAEGNHGPDPLPVSHERRRVCFFFRLSRDHSLKVPLDAQPGIAPLHPEHGVHVLALPGVPEHVHQRAVLLPLLEEDAGLSVQHRPGLLGRFRIGVLTLEAGLADPVHVPSPVAEGGVYPEYHAAAVSSPVVAVTAAVPVVGSYQVEPLLELVHLFRQEDDLSLGVPSFVLPSGDDLTDHRNRLPKERYCRLGVDRERRVADGGFGAVDGFRRGLEPAVGLVPVGFIVSGRCCAHLSGICAGFTVPLPLPGCQRCDVL
mmetsp:Transcript_32386/g.59548  ORF Transcript_32386/g.59548 Transcript_32386/m.59548 type:complete len:275 (-) Transcript_32386:8-832(-)